MRVRELIKELEKYEDENPIVEYFCDDYHFEVTGVNTPQNAPLANIEKGCILLG